MKENKSIKGFSTFPGLVMVDGGKGQVNTALDVLEELDWIFHLWFSKR